VLHRLADAEPTPWPNGGGVTRDLASGGAASGGAASGGGGADVASDDWGWRVSVATVDRPGPFSHLPGIDRVSVCLGPADLRLVIGRDPVAVQPGEAVRYRGEDPVDGLTESTTLVGNVMLRRSGFRFEDDLERADMVVSIVLRDAEDLRTGDVFIGDQPAEGSAGSFVVGLARVDAPH
jgi:uncharacterized protein